jgi:hypothetical protein
MDMCKTFNPDNYTHYDLGDWKQFSSYGVYGLYNNDNNSLYIGHSTANVGVRISHHISRLKTNHHDVDNLQRDWNLKHWFTFIILESNEDPIYIAKQEQMYIQLWKSILYNTTVQITDLPLLNPEQMKQFWSYIDKRTDSQCWLWTNGLNGQGYGRIGYNYKRYLAHRIVYCLHNNQTLQDIAGLVVRHVCDNKACCNPHHLVVGTVKDNADDRTKRNLCRKSQFNKKDIERMIKLRQQGKTCLEIAHEFNVGDATICSILSGNRKSTRVFVKDFDHTQYDRTIKGLMQADIDTMCELSKCYPASCIAKRYNMDTSYLRRVLHGQVQKYNLPSDYDYNRDRYHNTR